MLYAIRVIHLKTTTICNDLGEIFTHSVEEYTIGRGEMEDLLILLISPAMSCLIKSFMDLINLY